MGLTAWCPRCRRSPLPPGSEACPVHGAVPTLWRPEEASYDAFVGHLRTAAGFPTYLPWPMSPGWRVSDFGVVADARERPRATAACVTGTTDLDGRVDVLVVAEEPGVGLGGRCADLPGADPDIGFGQGAPAVRVRINSQLVPMWPVSTSRSGGDLDRSVVAGEAGGRWLWVVLLPASAMLLMHDDWILRDVSGIGPPLVEMPFEGPGPAW